MSRFNKSIAAFMAGIAFCGAKSQASQHEPDKPFGNTIDPISLRPINQAGDNMYAAHRSHSSHSSHASHRSSSGSYSAPKPVSPIKRPPSSSYGSSTGTGSSQSVDPGRPATVTPTGRDIDPNNAKLMNLIRRVQLELTIRGYTPGPIDGVMGAKTRTALKKFQRNNGLNPDGLMGTETLNRLNIVVP